MVQDERKRLIGAASRMLGADDGGGAVEGGDDVEAHLGEVVVQQLQEERQQLLDCEGRCLDPPTFG